MGQCKSNHTCLFMFHPRWTVIKEKPEPKKLQVVGVSWSDAFFIAQNYEGFHEHGFHQHGLHDIKIIIYIYNIYIHICIIYTVHGNTVTCLVSSIKISLRTIKPPGTGTSRTSRASRASQRSASQRSVASASAMGKAGGVREGRRGVAGWQRGAQKS